MDIIVTISAFYMSAWLVVIPTKSLCSFSAIMWKFVAVCPLVALAQDVTCVPMIFVTATVVTGVVVVFFAEILVMIGLVILFW